VPTSLNSWLIFFGGFAAKRKSSGTDAAQRVKVWGLCERWNVELISAAENRVA
jgi:hypothetical protein